MKKILFTALLAFTTLVAFPVIAPAAPHPASTEPIAYAAPGKDGLQARSNGTDSLSRDRSAKHSLQMNQGVSDTSSHNNAGGLYISLGALIVIIIILIILF